MMDRLPFSPTILGLGVLFSATLGGGQILFKLAAAEIGAKVPQVGLLGLLSWYLFWALVVYAFATALWVYILTQIPVSLAYPFSLMAVVVTLALARILLGEMLTVRQLIGFAVVLLGIGVIYTT